MSDAGILVQKESILVDMAKEACKFWGSRSVLRRGTTYLELMERFSLFDIKLDGDPDQARIFVIDKSGDNILRIESLSNTRVISIPIFTLRGVIHVNLEDNVPDFTSKLADTLEMLSHQESKRYEALLNCCGKDARLNLVVQNDMAVQRSGHLDTGDFEITIFEEIGLAVSLNVIFAPRPFRLVSK